MPLIEKKIALYHHLNYKLTQLYEVDEAMEQSTEWVRASNILVVGLNEFSEAQLVEHQLAGLQRKEQVARNSFQRTLNEIARKRAEIQRLSYIPAVEVVPGADPEGPTEGNFHDDIPF